MTVPPVPLLEQMDQIDRQAQVQGGQGQEKTEEKTGGQGEGQGGGGGEGEGTEVDGGGNATPVLGPSTPPTSESLSGSLGGLSTPEGHVSLPPNLRRKVL